MTQTPNTPTTGRFVCVNLVLNIEGQAGAAGACNPGGSIICTTGTRCPPGTCAGTSTKLAAETGIEASVLVQQEELAALQAEIQRVVSEFAGRCGG